MKTRTKVIIAIGSNRNQEENLSKAYEHLKYMFKNSLFGPRMWTEPIGLENSDKFLNQVMHGHLFILFSLFSQLCSFQPR